MKQSNIHKYNKNAIGVLAILFVLFTIIVFVIPFELGGVFWISYLFSVVSFVFEVYTLHKSFDNDSSCKSKFYGVPIAHIGSTYLAVQIIVCIIFMAIGKFIPIWPVVLVYLIMFAVALLGLITTIAVRDEIERQDTELKKSVSFMRSLFVKTQSIIDLCGDASVLSELRDFSEAVRYSDPVSGYQLAEVETNLLSLVDEIYKACIEADYVSAGALCKKAVIVLNERNRLCKLNK